MRRPVRPYGQLLLIPAILSVYILSQWLLPSNIHAIWLGIAAVVAARAWEVRGGVITGVIACLCLAFGFWQTGRPLSFSNPLMLSGYSLTSISILSLGYYVGSLTQQTRRLAAVNAELRQAQQQLSALHQIALSLSTTLDSQRLMEIILEQLGKLWGYDYGAIMLVDEATGELVLAKTQGYDSTVGTRLKPGEGIAGAAVTTGRPICVGDVTAERRYVTGLSDARSELAIPLTWEGEILGVLNVESREPNAYQASDVELLTTVAEQAASYLANARLHQHTRHLAITDPHTGLFNYRHYMDQVASLLNQAQLTGTQFALLMLDLDHFKRCNDTYGHPTGDVILEQTAQVIRLSCRQEDLIFRYGGEEFAVILPGADKAVAARVAERIRLKVASHTFTNKQGRALEFPLSASIGVAGYPEDGIAQVDLLLAADRALYAAKRTGRNRVVLAGTVV